MAVVGTFLHALRGTAERAFGHVRPPGAFKPGSAQWKAQLQAHARSKLLSPQPIPTSSSSTFQPSSNSVPKVGLQYAFQVVLENAIFPVFRQMSTGEIMAAERKIAADVRAKARPGQGSLFRSSFSKGFTRSPIRPKNAPPPSRPGRTLVPFGAGAGVGAGGAAAGTIFDLLFQAPLGIRATADELEDQLRQYGRTEKKADRFAKSSRGSIKREPTVKIPKVSEMIAEANALNPNKAASMCLSHDTEDCLSCSSSLISFGDSISLQEEDDDFHFIDESVPSPWVVTTLNVPMSPELGHILAADLEPEPDDVMISNNVWRQMSMIAAAFDDYRLRVIIPLERALESGHLSRLHPQNWGPNDLLQGMDASGVWQLPYLPITFINYTQDEVLDQLTHDVTPAVFRWLRDFIQEEQFSANEDGVEVQVNINRPTDTQGGNLRDEDEDEDELGTNTKDDSCASTQMGDSSGDDLGHNHHQFGPATLASMEQLDGEVSFQDDLHSVSPVYDELGDSAMPWMLPLIPLPLDQSAELR